MAEKTKELKEKRYCPYCHSEDIEYEVCGNWFYPYMSWVCCSCGEEFNCPRDGYGRFVKVIK